MNQSATAIQETRTKIGMTQYKAFMGAYFGYALDAMDFLFLSMIIPLVMRDLKIPLQNAAFLFSATLLGAFVGGVVFGILSDKIGRLKTMMITIVGYACFTGLCGFVDSFSTLLIFRFLVGLFLGGEWGAGGALVMEVWPALWRGRIGGILQTSWQVGNGLAALVTLLVAPAWGWRAVFFIGILPALFALWIRFSVKESPVWEETKRAAEKAKAAPAEGKGPAQVSRNPLAEMFSGELRRRAILISLNMACALFVIWGILAWLPTVLVNPPYKLTIVRSMHYVMIYALGTLVGQVSLGYLMDWIGRKRAFLINFGLGTIALVIYPNILDVQTFFWATFFMGVLVNNVIGGYAAYVGELFPTRMRGTAINWVMGFGRGVSTLSPIFLAALAPKMGLGGSFVTLAAVFFMGFLCILGLPETKGTEFKAG